MRKTDQSHQTHYITCRFFYTDDGWFSLTREKTLGPYPVKGLAVQATKNHLHRMESDQTAGFFEVSATIATAGK